MRLDRNVDMGVLLTAQRPPIVVERLHIVGEALDLPLREHLLVLHLDQHLFNGLELAIFGGAFEARGQLIDLLDGAFHLAGE